MHEELAAALGVVMGVVNMAFFSLAGASLVLVRPHTNHLRRRVPGPAPSATRAQAGGTADTAAAHAAPHLSSHVCCMPVWPCASGLRCLLRCRARWPWYKF